MASDGQHCSFVLLSEFDIDTGPKLIYQFPQPLGTDESLMANLMLPDGAEKQLEDWTIFFLNQTPFNTIAPVLALETPELNVRRASTGSNPDDEGKPELLYVLNLVRTKHDKSLKRGGAVKAMAICTRYPFIQIFKPVLLMALDDYFGEPSQEILARLFDAINSIDLSAAPTLTRHEKLVMRTSDRKDIFSEKFALPTLAKGSSDALPLVPNRANHKANGSWDSRASFDDGIVMRGRHDREDTEPEESLDGSTVWTNSESGHDTSTINGGTLPRAAKAFQPRGRSSTDASSSSGHSNRRGDEHGQLMTASTASPTTGMIKDTRSFQTSILYKGHQLPIKMPLSTFPEEVGEYSLIQLIQTFSSPLATLQGPLHPHLHSNGGLTHPIILLFNALVTNKRIIFLGHNRPAGQVSGYVLSACALGSGCGTVLRGFIERAFPYANLINRDEWESIPGYIAGVTNPIFESFDTWDVLCDVGTGRIVVSKDIHAKYPATASPTVVSNPLIVRSGTLKAEGSLGSEEDMARAPQKPEPAGLPKNEYNSKADSTDNLFIEDIISAIQYHFGESLVRARFSEYVTRFVRVAARYEEETLGSTHIGFPSVGFADRHLGSGIVFLDEAAGTRELAANAFRIEAWRKTRTYEYYKADFMKNISQHPLQGFDVAHQLWRLRHARNMLDAEVELIMRTIADRLQSYEAVVELLSYLPPHLGGLLPISFGLLHQQDSVRELTVDIFNALRQHAVGVHFLQSLNHFQRYAYVRQAHVREARLYRDPQPQNMQLYPPPSYNGNTPNNRSASSLNNLAG